MIVQRGVPPQTEPPATLGLWIIAGTPISWPYPCGCDDDQHYKRPIDRRCWCYGRTDLLVLPRSCCARRAA